MENFLESAMKIRHVIVILLILLPVSCIREELFRTNHPDYGKLILIPDWSECNADITIPDELMIKVNGETTLYPYTGDSIFVEDLFDPDKHDVYILNETSNLTVSDNIVSLNETNGYADSMPDWFFSSRKTVFMEKDQDYIVPMLMKQHVNSIRLSFASKKDDITNISSVTGSLSGIATSIDISNNSVRGNSGTILLDFYKNVDLFVSDFRLIGTHPNYIQELIINLNTDSGETAGTIHRILTNEFTNFNSKKNEPLNVSIDVTAYKYAARFITDWSNRGVGVAKPVEYVIRLGAINAKPSSDSYIFDMDYRLSASYSVWNIADKISVTNTTANIQSTGEGIIDNMPGWLHTATGSVQLRSGMQDINVKTTQQIREVNIILDLTKEKLAMIDGINTLYIDGIAGSYNIATDSYENNSKIVPEFTLSNDRFLSKSRILGIVPGNTQSLSFELLYKDGTTDIVTKDISIEFLNFNADKKSPKTITIDISNDIEELRNINFTSNWSNIGSEVPIPSSYQVHLGTISQTLSSSQHTFKTRIKGVTPVRVYNSPSNITIANFIATVTTTSGKVAPLPGWLFSYADNIDIGDSNPGTVQVTMTQNIRQLNLILESDQDDFSKVTGISGTMKGVANRFNIITGVEYGDNISVDTDFTKADGKFGATVRLAGIESSESQTLTLTITFSDNSTYTLDPIDLSTELSGFNSNKKSPMTLTSSIKVSYKGIFTAEIEDWEVGDDETIVAI